MAERSTLDVVFAPLDALGRAAGGARRALIDFAREVLLLRVVFFLILAVTTVVHVGERVLGVLDEVLDRVETGLIFFAGLAMTALVF